MLANKEGFFEYNYFVHYAVQSQDMPKNFVMQLIPPQWGVLNGRVSDKNNNPLGGIHVKLIGTDHATFTKQNGFFHFAVPVGSYFIKASESKFKDYFSNEIVVKTVSQSNKHMI